MRDVLETMASLPRELATIVQQAGDSAIDTASQGEWSVRLILAHLRDEESLVFRLRVEPMLSEREPEFAVYPPARWHEERRTDRDELRQLLRDFALQRQASLNLLETMRPRDWERTGIHPQRGAFTVEGWVRNWAEHDREHLEQIERTLQGKAS
jgi:hypothetical protein